MEKFGCPKGSGYKHVYKGHESQTVCSMKRISICLKRLTNARIGRPNRIRQPTPESEIFLTLI